MAKKERPCLIDEIRQELTPEEDRGLLSIANKPNPYLTDIQSYLREIGYKASVNAVSTWYARHRVAGEKAKTLNSKLEEYRGVDALGTLEKLLTDTITEIDIASAKAINGDASDSDYLKALPHLRRSAISCIEAFYRLGQLKEKQELELAGAMRMAEELKIIFKETAFVNSLEEAIKSVMITIKC